MKKLLILSMAAFLIFGFTSWASADLTTPYGTAQFFAVDAFGTGGGDGSVTLSSSNWTGGTLQYRLGSTGDFTTVSDNKIVVTTPSRQLVQFQVVGITNPTMATMTFFGPDGSLYNSVLLNFHDNNIGIFRLAFETPSLDDHASPVPLPGAVWLLGAGLIGLVGVRRKFRS